MSGNVTVEYAPGAAEFALALFGRAVGGEELAAAAGALDGAHLDVSVRKGSELLVAIRHPWLVQQERGFRRDDAGALYIWNHHFEKRHDAPPSVGLQSFRRQVAGARQLGVQRIELWAAGDPLDNTYNGYYTWARFGFNAGLDAAMRSKFPAQFAAVTTLNELIERGGLRLWKEFGSARKMVFELSDDSSMMRVFRGYLAEKGLG